MSAVQVFSETLWKKEKLLFTSKFFFSLSVFYPFGELFAIFIKFRIVVCKLSIWKSLKFVVLERDKQPKTLITQNEETPLAYRLNLLPYNPDL